jgi:hypothetical protein
MRLGQAPTHVVDGHPRLQQEPTRPVRLRTPADVLGFPGPALPRVADEKLESSDFYTAVGLLSANAPLFSPLHRARLRDGGSPKPNKHSRLHIVYSRMRITG